MQKYLIFNNLNELKTLFNVCYKKNSNFVRVKKNDFFFEYSFDENNNSLV